MSEFYGSVYTHSIEWALHTKAVAKAHLSGAKGAAAPLLGGLIDAAIRKGQDGQTKGIPVGPDTSLLVGELIMCAIDAVIEAKHKDVARFGVRFMDDFELAARSRSEAEDVLLTWDGALAAYDLTLNSLKTVIVDGPLSPEEPWKVQLKHFNIRTETDVKNANDIRSLFSLAFNLARDNPTKPVLKYALRRAQKPVGPIGWGVYSDLALSVVVAEPVALEAAYDAFVWARTAGYPLDSTAIEETLNEMCEHHAPLEHGSEVAWSSFILRELGLTVSNEAANRIAGMRDNCSLLLLLAADASGSIHGPGPNLSLVVARAEDADAWHSEDWLLAYEAGRHGWANDAAFMAQPHWAELRRAGVYFFDPNSAAVAATSAGATATTPTSSSPGGGSTATTTSSSGSAAAATPTSAPSSSEAAATASGDAQSPGATEGGSAEDGDATPDIQGVVVVPTPADDATDGEDEEGEY